MQEREYLTRLERKANIICSNAMALDANIERHEDIRLASVREVDRMWHARPNEYHGNASKDSLKMQIRILRNDLLELSDMLDEKEEDDGNR